MRHGLEVIELTLAVLFVGIMPRMILFKDLILDDPDVHGYADCVHKLFNCVFKTLCQFFEPLAFCSSGASGWSRLVD